jgi:hypothetical protein
MEAGTRAKSAFGGMSVGEKYVEENTDNIAEESSGSAAPYQRLNSPISKAVSEWNRHRETYRAEHKSYQEPFSHLFYRSVPNEVIMQPTGD